MNNDMKAIRDLVFYTSFGLWFTLRLLSWFVALPGWVWVFAIGWLSCAIVTAAGELVLKIRRRRRRRQTTKGRG